jgi:hypothetical protein
MPDKSGDYEILGNNNCIFRVKLSEIIWIPWPTREVVSGRPHQVRNDRKKKAPQPSGAFFIGVTIFPEYYF